MARQDWIWMPHPAHFIGGFDCRFHLATKVGDVIISTVGEYFPDSEVRDIFAQSRGITLRGRGDEKKADYMKKIGFEDIGYNRKYETMVFPAIFVPDGDCCKWRCNVSSHGELDMDAYNTPEAAYNGHMILCTKWDGRDVPPSTRTDDIEAEV